MPDEPILELRGITKRFPGIVANDGIEFDLRRGEIPYAARRAHVAATSTSVSG